MPRIPATKMKSPARVPRFHAPVGLIAPSGESVLTPFGDTCCARIGSPGTATTATIQIRITTSSDVLRVGAVFWTAPVDEHGNQLGLRCQITGLISRNWPERRAGPSAVHNSLILIGLQRLALHHAFPLLLLTAPLLLRAFPLWLLTAPLLLRSFPLWLHDAPLLLCTFPLPLRAVRLLLYAPPLLLHAIPFILPVEKLLEQRLALLRGKSADCGALILLLYCGALILLLYTSHH